MKYSEVIHFWFTELETKQWWIKDTKLDQVIRDRFLDIHSQAINTGLSRWRSAPEGRLAEIIALDKFSRNIFRDKPEAFDSDEKALHLAQAAIDIGADKELETSKKPFLYMPFMHSESLSVHERAVEIFSEPGLEGMLEFELKHKKIIDQFGRYPHRNKILGRESTTAELEFLESPGSSF